MGKGTENLWILQKMGWESIILVSVLYAKKQNTQYWVLRFEGFIPNFAKSNLYNMIERKRHIRQLKIAISYLGAPFIIWMVRFFCEQPETMFII
uniref:Uncharacterized protein n=1 Tax=Prevotella sp. GTC17262 TaxID=3236797 RepID=A0AB33JK18_9BACT